MMAILKQSIEAFRSGGMSDAGTRAAHAGTLSGDDEAIARDWPDTANDERRSPQRSEEMFYWGMAGGPWY